MSYMGRVWLWNQTHTQTEHLVVLFTLYTKWRLFCVLTAVTLGLRRKVYCLLSLLCSYYTFMCPWADFYSAHPNSLSLSVFLSLQARQRACPSISAVWCMRHTRIHHTLDGGAHHNVTFNLDETEVCLAYLMGWPMAGKCWLMPQITSASPILSFFGWDPPPSTHGGPSFTALCTGKVPFCAKLHMQVEEKGIWPFDPRIDTLQQFNLFKILTWLFVLKFYPQFEHTTILPRRVCFTDPAETHCLQNTSSPKYFVFMLLWPLLYTWIMLLIGNFSLLNTLPFITDIGASLPEMSVHFFCMSQRDEDLLWCEGVSIRMPAGILCRAEIPH